jgi:hypothetical protein
MLAHNVGIQIRFPEFDLLRLFDAYAAAGQ